MYAVRTCNRLVAVACMVVPVFASAACYQLFDKQDRLVLQSTTSPVDLSKSISEEVGRLYPGHYLIMDGDGPCPDVDELNRAQRTVKLPAESLNRGPIQIAAESPGSDAPQAQPRASCVESGPTPARANSGGQHPRLTPPCYTG